MMAAEKEIEAAYREEMQRRLDKLEAQVKALQQAQPYRYVCGSCGSHVKDVQMHNCATTAYPSFRAL